METEKREDCFRPLLGEEVGAALRGCQMSARGFFYELAPMLRRGKPYGHIQMSAEDLSLHFKISYQMTRRYIFELKNHKVLKETRDGDLYCPPLIREWVLRGTA